MRTRFLGRISGVLVSAAMLNALLPAASGAEIADLIADEVFGQSGFADADALPLGPAGIGSPRGIAIDRSVVPNRLYVSDVLNNRVLGWANVDALASGAAADIVIGQPDFYSAGCHAPGRLSPVTLSTMCAPRGLAVDNVGNLYVADGENCRVLIFRDPFGTDQIADAVLGDANGCTTVRPEIWMPLAVAVDDAGNVFVNSFLTGVLEYDRPLATDAIYDRVFNSVNMPQSLAVDHAGTLYVGIGGAVVMFPDALNSPSQSTQSLGTLRCNESGESANSTCSWSTVALDDAGRLYVGDGGNSRVLEFDSPLTGGQAARVFGQSGFTGPSGAPDVVCNAGGASASSLCLASQLDNGASDYGGSAAVDSAGRLYVADTFNNRVLRYDHPLTSPVADLVLGHTAMDDTRTPVVPVGAPHAMAGDWDAVIDTANSRVLLYLRGFAMPRWVIGQPDFGTTGCNSTGVNAGSLCHPTAGLVAVTSLWVADTGNNRVLEYDISATDYNQGNFWTRASRVFGQPDLNSNAPGAGPGGLNGPRGMGYVRGTMFIGDSGNNRVVRYDYGSTAANAVYGQADFNGTLCNAGGLGAASLCDPEGLALTFGDPNGNTFNLFVADRGNNRVLEYDDVVHGTGVANRVFGQTSMTAAACAAGPGGLCGAADAATDYAGNLLVADTENNRVLVYLNPLGSDAQADLVFGQPDFDSTGCNTGGRSAQSLCQPEGAAVGDRGVLIADSGNNRVLRFETPYCVNDYQLTPVTRLSRGFRFAPRTTSVQVLRGAGPGTDTLKFSGTLFDADGVLAGNPLGFQPMQPLLTLSTASGGIYRERVPYLENRVFRNRTLYFTPPEIKGGAAGIDEFLISDTFVAPRNVRIPEHDVVTYRGRSTGHDMSSFTESQATFRLQFGGECFTTQLTCRNTVRGRSCAPAR